jgi:hypothetical protein
MSYLRETYRQETGSYCERHNKVFGKTLDDYGSRLVVLEGLSPVSSSHPAMIFLCRECINDISALLSCETTTGQTSFHWTWENVVKHANIKSRDAKVSITDLLSTMSKYEDESRNLIKRVRNYDGIFTNRNEACKALADQFKKIYVAVNKFSGKT